MDRAPDALAVSLFSEILAVDQLTRMSLARVLPRGMELSHFSVLNHLAHAGGEKTPAQLARCEAETAHRRHWGEDRVHMIGAGQTASRVNIPGVLGAMVVEGVVEGLAIDITQSVGCVTIGIGAAAQCDGQVLVVDDMLGMFERVPRFVERFDDLAGRISAAAADYAARVRSRAFPTDAQLYR